MNTKQNVRATPSLVLIQVYIEQQKTENLREANPARDSERTYPGQRSEHTIGQPVINFIRIMNGGMAPEYFSQLVHPRRMSQPGSSLSSVCLSSSPSASHLKQPPCAEWFLSLTMERRGTKPCASHERGVSLQHHDFSLATTAPCSVAAAAHRSSWSRQRMPETAWTRTPQL